MFSFLTVFRSFCSKPLKTRRCGSVAGRRGRPVSDGRTLWVPCVRLRVQEAQLPGLALLLGLLPPERHLRGHHSLPLRYQGALGAHAVPPAAEALVAFERGDHAMVPASGALRGARVPSLQRGAASPEKERRRAHDGRGHLQTVPGEAERSDPAVHPAGERRKYPISSSGAALKRGLVRFCVLCRWHSRPARLKCLLRWLDVKPNTAVTPLSAAAS